MANSMTAVKPLPGAPSPGVTLAIMCLYAIIVLAAAL
jgi:hypothetical protein